MLVHTIMNETQKKELEAAAKACGLSNSSMLKLALKEKIQRMANETKMNVAPAATLDGKQRAAANTPNNNVSIRDGDGRE